MTKVERFSEDWNRKARHEFLLESGEGFTYEQIRDAVNLVMNDQVPDGRFSDAECNLWELLMEVKRKFKNR